MAIRSFHHSIIARLSLFLSGTVFREKVRTDDWQKREGVTPMICEYQGRFTEIEALSKRFDKYGYKFVPLVNDVFNTVCGLDILFLRREDPGQLITSESGGDIDNRMKTLLDALQIPNGCTQVDGLPAADETPFYTLLQNDGQVTDLKITTDRLLEPLEHGEKQNDVVLIIQAHIKTSQAWFDAENSAEF